MSAMNMQSRSRLMRKMGFVHLRSGESGDLMNATSTGVTMAT